MKYYLKHASSIFILLFCFALNALEPKNKTTSKAQEAQLLWEETKESAVKAVVCHFFDAFGQGFIKAIVEGNLARIPHGGVHLPAEVLGQKMYAGTLCIVLPTLGMRFASWFYIGKTIVKYLNYSQKNKEAIVEIS